MRKIIRFFTHRIVISFIGLMALSLIVWFAGPLIKFGEDNSIPLGTVNARLIAIIVLVVLWGLNNLRIQLMSQKNNDVLLGDLEQNHVANTDELPVGQSLEELQTMTQRFTDALETLKKLKFKGKGGKKALYELPWYIIIGPPGSGKTTALVNSSLDFPLAEQFGKGALQGIGGTRNCDWWFTNEAVLIDTAGRYTTQDSHIVEDKSAWENFLQLLKKNRRRRPINGAIIAISIHDLLLQTEEERVQHSKTIRLRIDELQQKLEIRFPIYLMFTKSDMVSGFSEYFEDLGKEEREQVWGISLPNAENPSQSPDFEFLNIEYNKLLERLYSRELSRIHYERDVKRRAVIQGFPQQIENLKSVIDSFVKQTFVKNRFEFQPYLRGIYFTSGAQDGTPIDRMMSSVSANFGFSRDQSLVHQGQGKSYFLGNLFRDVIFPESELVGSNRKYEVMIKWGQRLAYAALASVFFGLLTIWTSSIKQHNTYMDEVASYITVFNIENKRLNLWNKDLRAVLPTLNALAKASIVYDQNNDPWLSGMGLYDSNVDSSANEAYEAQLHELYLPRLINYLEKQLAKGHKGGDLYHSFRAYLMFHKTDKMDRRLIKDWFVTDWKNNMQGEGSKRKELELHLNALLDLDLKPYTLNAKLLKQTRKILLRVPVHRRIYSRIRTNPDYNQKVNILNMFGEAVRDTYLMNESVNDSLLVPIMFTKEGYESIDLSTESPVIADIVNERWVLTEGKDKRVDFVKDDLEEISAKVKKLYMADYIANWKKVYAGLKVDKFKNIQHATDLLSGFSDPVYSPLISILQVAAENTQLSSALAQNLNDDHGKGKVGSVTGFLANKFKGTKVDQQFRDINILLRESKKKQAPIALTLQKLQTLQDFIAEISVAPEPDKKAYQIAKVRFSSGSGNAITALTRHAKKMPAPIKRWLLTIADESWKVVLSSAHQYVNREWNERVYSEYKQAIAGRYPLRRDSKTEMTILDFSEFFKAEGTIDKFYVELIKPFVNTRKGWKNKVIDRRSLGLSNKTLKQIRQAQIIKSIYFNKGAEVPSVAFQLKPYRMNKTDISFLLEVGEQRISYSHGPKFWKNIQWSSDDESKRIRLVFEDSSENKHEKFFYGPWSLFKFQDASAIKKTKTRNVYLATYKVRDGFNTNIHTISYLLKAKSVNNPFDKNYLSSFKCSSSI